MDLIIGKGGKEAILTLEERLTGYLIIERLSLKGRMLNL